MGKNGNLYELEYSYRCIRSKVISRIDTIVSSGENYDYTSLIDLLNTIDNKLDFISKSITHKLNWSSGELKQMYNEFIRNKKDGRYSCD